jgi:hypothetical protein
VGRRSIRFDVDEAVKVPKAKFPTQTAHAALRKIVALKRFKDLMKKNAGNSSSPEQISHEDE